MKKSLYLFLITLGFAACQNKPAGSEDQKGDLSALAAEAGKYPKESGLLQNSALSERLTALMGEAAYQQMLQEWNTESPVAEEAGILHTSGCQDNNCGAVGYHLYIDPAGDNINLFGFRSGELTTFAEKGAIRLPEGLARELEVVKLNAGLPLSQIDPDPTDDVPADRYTASSANLQMALSIKNALVYDLLKDDVAALTPEQRRFIYQSHDLNGDGKDEYLIGLENPYYCGSGGCTYLLLDHEANLVTRFTVSRSPFIVLPEKSKGWNDLLVESDGKLRKLVFDGKSYPSNPSVEPEFTAIPGDDLPRLLWHDFPIPTFTF